MLDKLLAIVKNTFTETIRQPVFGLLVLVIVGCLTINTMVAAFSTSPSEEIYDDNKMMYDLGLSTLLIGGLLLAGFSSAGVFSREIENKTVLTVISKPVSRPIFVLGKFLGLAGALTVACYVCALVFFLNARHGVMQASSQRFDWPVILFGCGAVLIAVGIAVFTNYFYGWHFSSTSLVVGVILLTLASLLVGFIDKNWQFQPFAKDMAGTQLPTAVLLIWFAVMILNGVALAASTRLGQVMTLLVCFFVLALGLMSDYFFQSYAFPTYKPLAATQPSGTDTEAASRLLAEIPSAGTTTTAPGTPSPTEPVEVEETRAVRPRIAKAGARTAQILARTVYAVIPNMQYFWVSDAVILRRPIPAGHVLWLFGYALFYVAALVLLAVALFQTREVAAETSASAAPPIVHFLGVIGRVAAALQVGGGVWWMLNEAIKPREMHLVQNLAAVGIGVFLWFFWGWFARGMKWTWFVVVILLGIAPILIMVYVLIRQPLAFSPLFAAPGITAILALTIIGKSGRLYFGFGKERRRRRAPTVQPDAG